MRLLNASGCLDALIAEAAATHPAVLRMAPGVATAPALTAALAPDAAADRQARSRTDCGTGSEAGDDQC